jgi:hypothetical protein
MKARVFAALLLGLMLAGVATTHAQAPRVGVDVIWARSTDGAPITLDGVLDEPAWAVAESVVIRYAQNTGIPGSGWKPEGGINPKDPSYVTVKFLADTTPETGNQLYMAAVVRDSSVGGSALFNLFDGFLMMIMDHSNANRPTPLREYFYSWWHPQLADPLAPGLSPGFRGYWSPNDDNVPRTEEQIAAWDAVTRVHGLSNSEAVLDTGYTVEMRFALGVDGYDVTQVGGDVIEWSIDVYDCDWYWPELPKLSYNRVWWQNPWGNVSWYSEVKIYARPDVTVSSGPVPAVGPDLRVPNAASYAAPTIDGLLTEQVWQQAPSFDIRYGDDALRETYPGIGKFRSGQYQPPVNGGQAYVVDPGDATIRWFFKDDMLYVGFDVRDQAVQYHPISDRWDGFTFTINDRTKLYSDKNLVSYRTTFIVGPSGELVPKDSLINLLDRGAAQAALALKPGTTVDTVGLEPDVGYTAELAIDLTKIGYPAGRGDGTIFLGVDLLDGDSFTPSTDSYATRTWFFRETEYTNGPAWGYMDPTYMVVGVQGEGGVAPGPLALLGNYPNPFRDNTAIRFMLPEARDITLDVFDLQGRLVASRALGVRTAGAQRALFNRAGLGSGLYLYRVRLADPTSRAAKGELSGKMMLLK